MRITTILIFIIAFSFTNAMLNTLGIFGTAPEMQSSQLIQTINDTTQEYSYGSAQVGDVNTSFGVGDFVFSLLLFIKIFGLGLFLPYTMLTTFGINSTLALMFTFPIYLIYLIAIIQMISGRYLE